MANSVIQIMKMNINVLKAGINRTLDDTREAGITAETLLGFSGGDWKMVKCALKEWESRGLLQVLSDPEQCASDEICVKMLSYLDRRSSIPGFLND
jgi:hypothetical protein